MSTDNEAAKRNYQEFIHLLPMTLSIAGLHPAEGAKSFTSEQMQARANTIKNAYKVARQAFREAIQGS